MKEKEMILAKIEAMRESLDALTALVMSQDDDENELVTLVDMLKEPITEELVEVPEAVEVKKPYDFSEEIMFANMLLTERDYTNWADWQHGPIDCVNIRIKSLPPRKEGDRPYVLWREGILEVEAYDVDGESLGISPQFHRDNLSPELLKYLRTKANFCRYEKKTYQPLNTYLMVRE